VSRAQTYLLPVHAIIEGMQELRERVLLCASVPAGPELGGHEGIAALVICELHTGRLLVQNQEALRIHERCGILTWTLQPPQRLTAVADLIPAPMHGPDAGSAPVPMRLVELTPAQMQRLPSAHKKVYALVDGAHSVEHIAHLLSRSPQDVFQVLLDLKRHRLIDI
jgi:hypothetical protein